MKIWKKIFLEMFSNFFSRKSSVFYAKKMQKFLSDVQIFWKKNALTFCSSGARNWVGKKKSEQKKRYHDDDHQFCTWSNYSLSCQSFCLSLPFSTSKNFFLCFPPPKSIQKTFWEIIFAKKFFWKKKSKQIIHFFFSIFFFRFFFFRFFFFEFFVFFEFVFFLIFFFFELFFFRFLFSKFFFRFFFFVKNLRKIFFFIVIHLLSTKKNIEKTLRLTSTF